MQTNGKTRMLNEVAAEQMRLKYRHFERIRERAPIASKRLTIQAVAVLPVEQKEHLMHLLATELGAPFRRDFKYICHDKLNITVQAGDWLRCQPMWEDVCKQILSKIRRKYLAQIQGKAIELAMLGSKYHTDLILNLEKILEPKKIEHTHRHGDIPDDPKEVGEEIRRLQSEVGELEIPE